MKGNFQVRFLEEGERAIALSYSTITNFKKFLSQKFHFSTVYKKLT